MRTSLLFVVFTLLATLAKGDPIGMVDTVTFNDTCTGDAGTGFMQTPVLWQSTPNVNARGSIFTFDACGLDVPSFGFVRLIIHVQGTDQMVANFAIPVADPVPSNSTSGCLAYSASTNLSVIMGTHFVRELRAVTDSNDSVNFLARRCGN